MHIVVTKYDSNDKPFDTLELVSGFWDTYVVHPDTTIIEESPIEFVGYEFSGKVGGYSVASRQTRRPFTLVFNITERYNISDGLYELYAKAKAFFDPHHDDLSPIRYDISFYTCDKKKTSYQARHGAISVGLSCKVNPGENTALAQVSFLFDDPHLYRLGDGVGVYRGSLMPLYSDGSLYGRLWGTDGDSTRQGATWTTEDIGGKIWILGEPGTPGTPVTFNVHTSTRVRASVTIHGHAIDPIIRNITNNTVLRFNATIPEGATVTVDEIGNISTTGMSIMDLNLSTGFENTLSADNGNNTFIYQGESGTNGKADITIIGAI
jgi:hypothetical protein